MNIIPALFVHTESSNNWMMLCDVQEQGRSTPLEIPSTPVIMQNPNKPFNEILHGIRRHLHYKRGTSRLIIQSSPVDCLDGCWYSQLCLL